LPLRFEDEDDYEKFEQGQQWELPDLRKRLENGDEEIPARMEGTEITLLAEYSPRERDILLSGGILRQLREKEDKQPEAPHRVSGEAER
jgi:aconitate hydratase